MAIEDARVGIGLFVRVLFEMFREAVEVYARCWWCPIYVFDKSASLACVFVAAVKLWVLLDIELAFWGIVFVEICCSYVEVFDRPSFGCSYG